MLEDLYLVIRSTYEYEGSKVEFLQGDSTSMLISIDGQQVLIQVR